MNYKLEIERIKKYIKENYDLDFYIREFDYNGEHQVQLRYKDIKRKIECYLYFGINCDNEIYLGYDIHTIPYNSGHSGPEKYEGDYTVDIILQQYFGYQPIKYQQISLF